MQLENQWLVTYSQRTTDILNSMLDAISNVGGIFASEAYLHGVVEGIALRGKVVTE